MMLCPGQGQPASGDPGCQGSHGAGAGEILAYRAREQTAQIRDGARQGGMSSWEYNYFSWSKKRNTVFVSLTVLVFLLRK